MRSYPTGLLRFSFFCPSLLPCICCISPQMRKLFSYIFKFSRVCHLSNTKRFACLHSLISTREGLGEFYASSVYIRLCKNRKKVFYCFYKINFPRKNAKLFVWYWWKEKFLLVAKSCPRSLARVISSCFAKRCFLNYGLFSLKMSA